MGVYAVILGAGSGSRMKSAVNKVFLPLEGVPVIIRSIAAFEGICDGAVVVAAPGETQAMEECIAQHGLSSFVLKVVEGGSERRHSVWNALKSLPMDAEYVLIHDGARALVTEEVIRASLENASAHGSGIASIPATDTIKVADGNGMILSTPDRSTLFAVQTPQTFRAELILSAYEKAENDGYPGTDDASMAEYAGHHVYLSRGDHENIKLTTPVDLAVAQVILRKRAEESRQ